MRGEVREEYSECIQIPHVTTRSYRVCSHFPGGDLGKVLVFDSLALAKSLDEDLKQQLIREQGI